MSFHFTTKAKSINSQDGIEWLTLHVSRSVRTASVFTTYLFMFQFLRNLWSKCVYEDLVQCCVAVLAQNVIDLLSIKEVINEI